MLIVGGVLAYRGNGRGKDGKSSSQANVARNQAGFFGHRLGRARKCLPVSPLGRIAQSMDVVAPTVHRFTPANAREMAAKGHQAKRAAAEQRQKRIGNVPHDATEYANIRLLRVRAQLNQLDEMIAEERDPQRLDRLASAQARLSVQEFALSGRPNPGSRRPGRESTSKAPSTFEPSE